MGRKLVQHGDELNGSGFKSLRTVFFPDPGRRIGQRMASIPRTTILLRMPNHQPKAFLYTHNP